MESIGYYSQWTYDAPLVITPETYGKMQFLQQCMYRCIRHFVLHYDRYQDLMPVSGRIQEVLDLCRDVPYRVGTYRTDFLITGGGSLQMMEITCRFALNAYIRSGFFNEIAHKYAEKHDISYHDSYSGFYDGLQDYFGAADEIFLLTNHPSDEGKYIIRLFEQAGYMVHALEYGELADYADRFENAGVISQLAHEELLALPDELITKMARSGLLNDFRTVLLIHDKRFFSVLNDDRFLEDVLGPGDASRFKAYVVPTYRRDERADLWLQARADKDAWIVKPHNLGKGIGVRAGILCGQREWEAVLDQGHTTELTLQPYIHQRLFSGAVGTESRKEDYIVGTLLFFEDHFYGPGLFRASTHPITNMGDDRKVAALITNELESFDKHMIL